MVVLDVCSSASGRRILALGVVFLTFGLGGVTQNEAVADEWTVESADDREQRIIERYRTMLESNPVEGMALDRLLGYVGRGAGLDRLISQYEARVEDSPDSVNLRLVLGHLLKARGDYDEAFLHYDRAVDLDSDSSQGWLSRGTVHLLRGDRHQAMADFEEALERESNRSRRDEILRELGELSFGQRDFERGMQFFERLLQNNPRDQFIRMDYVQLLVQYRQFEEAIEQYEALRPLVARDTRQVAILLRDKADVYEMKGDYDEALQTYEEAKGLVRSDSWLAREIRAEIVDVFRGAGRLADFVDEYGSRWRTGDVAQQTLLADVYAEMGRLEEALESYQRLARRDRRAIEPREKAIRVLERLGRDEEIPDAYRGLIQAAPQDERYAFRLARYHMRNGDRESATDVLRDVERRFANDSYVLLALADRYADWSFHAEAHEIYDRVLQREGDDDAVLIQVGDFYYDRGDRRRAIEIWEQLPNSRLGEREGRRRMAELMVQRGIMGEGIAAFQDLIGEEPDDERMLRAMARALERADRWDEALQTWFQLLELSEEPRRAREARTRIVEIYDRNQELQARIRQWEQTFEKPESDEALEAGFFLAEAMHRLQDHSGAEEVLLELERSDGISEEQLAVILLALERTYVQTERFDDAIEVLSRLKEYQPRQREELLNRMADYALDAGDGAAAVEYASRAIESNPDNAKAQAKVGDVYRDISDMEAAASHYQTAIDIDPRAHDVRLRLAEALLEMGRSEEAEEALMLVVNEATENQLIRDAGEQLLDIADEQGRLEALETSWAPLVFRMPIRDAHAQLIFDLYDRLAGPLLLTVHHGSVSARIQAARTLDELGGRAAPLLVEQLQREDSGARARALRMVAEMNVDLASPQVARLIASDDRRLRKMAIVVAARLGEERFVEPLQIALEDGSATARHLATWALGFIDSDAARQTLVDIADTEVDGTGPRLAMVGISSTSDPALEAVLLRDLQRLVDDPVAVERERAALLLAVVEGAIRRGEGEAFRPLITRLAIERSDRVGNWAARLLGAYGDEEAASVAWTLVFKEDSGLAHRGERALTAFFDDNGSTMSRSWGDEVRYFDWLDAEFEASVLLRRIGHKWTGQRRPRADADAWSDAVEQGLIRLLVSEEYAHPVRRTVARLGARHRDNGQASRFWSRHRTAAFSRVVLQYEAQAGLSHTDKMVLRVLHDGSLQLGADALDSDDDALASMLDAATAVGESAEPELLQALALEALGRSAPRLRRQALTALQLLSADAVDPELAGAIVDALSDPDRGVQLAAVRATGHLALADALDHLAALEQDARPALRRAVRQARRALAAD